MLIGYLRPYGDGEAGHAAQRQALTEAGCGQVVEEQPDPDGCGKQPELHALLARLRVGDVLVVQHLDSIGLRPTDLVRRVQRLTTAGAGLRSLAEAVEASASQGEAAVAAVDSVPARDGRNAPRPAAPGHPVAATRQRTSGRPPKLSNEDRAEIVATVLSERGSAADMARRYDVSEATVSRVLAAARAGAVAPLASGQAGKDAGHADRIAGVLPFSALDGRLAIVGTSGSGKTYAAKGLVERLLGRNARVCVVDPLGVWWGLREAPDGASPPPFPMVVFGGSRADVPLHAGMGAILGHLIGTHAVACVVDVSDLGSAAVRRAFMTVFTEALFAANTEPLHLVLDEADLWAPQRVQQDGYDLLGRIEEIVRRGRVRGFVPWLITQRPAVLNKDVLSQADILVSMKLTSSQDRAALGRWLDGQAGRGAERRILAELPQLARGEGFLWAPSDGVLTRVRFPAIRTFDSSRTPQRDEGIAMTRALATMDVSAFTTALADLGAFTPDIDAGPARGRRDPASGLKRRLVQMDRELAATRTRMAEMEAEAAVMQARLEQAERRDARGISAGTAPRRKGAAATPRKAERTEG